MTLRQLAVSLLAAAALAACDLGGDEQDVAPPVRVEPSIEARAVTGYADLSGDVVDIVLLPNQTPFLGRAIAALDTGGFVSFDLASSVSTTLDGPVAGALAAAPDFSLRGSAAPLLFATGGEIEGVRAWVYLVDEETLIDIPLDPIEIDGDILAFCEGRVTEAVADLIIATENAVETWQVRDSGGERLAVSRAASIETDEPMAACDSLGSSIVGVRQTGRAYEIGPADPLWGAERVIDAAVVPRADSEWVFLARPETGAGALITPFNDRVRVDFVEGFNTASTPAPDVLAGASENFGGPFSAGVLAAAQGNNINFMELGGLLDGALAAVREVNAADDD
ncbi:MAG: hypothetical protein PVI23_06650 [Maricaulaceae bacterium]|jgi:hypothetical protein